MPSGFFFGEYSCVPALERSIEKHDWGVERDAWLVLSLCLNFHAYSDE